MSGVRVTGRWLRVLRSLLPGPRATPFTAGLLLVFAASATALRWTAADDGPVLRWASTNLVNLDHHPVSALIASAFVSQGSIVRNFLILAVAGAALERRSTPVRTAAVITAGHVIASLITEGAVRIAIAMHTDSRSAARQVDIGISYVMFTVVGAALRFLPLRWRRVGVAGALAYVGAKFLRDPGMTSCGHLLSLSIGLLSWPLLVPAGDRAERPARTARCPALGSARLRITAAACLTAAGVLTACAPGQYLLGRQGRDAQCSTTMRCYPSAVQPGN